MWKLYFLATFIFSLQTKVFLETPLPRGTSASTLVTPMNCSQYESDPAFRIGEFGGSWNVVQFFTHLAIHSTPRCMKLDAEINSTKVLMNVALSTEDFTVSKNFALTGLVDMDKARQYISGTWSLFCPELSLAPSKWIVLAGTSSEVLYMICGDYPDQSSRVGEIGILSRDTTISVQEVRIYEQILLANYQINVTLQEISHSNCDH